MMKSSSRIPEDYPEVITQSIPEGHLPVGSWPQQLGVDEGQDSDAIREDKKRRSDRRVSVLRRVMDDRFEGKQVRLAEAVGRAPVP